MTQHVQGIPVRARRPEDQRAQLSRVFLWLNSGCNARCKMCDIWQEKPGTQLSLTDVKRLSDEWVELGVSRVVVCGEPLLHPELVGICAAIRARGTRLDLLTNGLLLERRAADVAGSCDALGVSLDGPEHVHNATRGRSDAFARLRAGVEAVRRLAPHLGVDGRCAVHRLNFRELRGTVRAAHEIGLRSISFSATDLHNEEAFRRGGRLPDAAESPLAIGAADLPDLEAELRALFTECAEDFATGFISDPPERLQTILVDHYRGINGLAPLRAQRCTAPWRSAVVEYDGTVRPCFPLPASGNVFDSGGLDAVVNSAANLAFRAALDVQTDLTCLTCVCQSDIDGDVAKAWDQERDRPAIAQLIEAHQGRSGRP